PGAVRRAIRFPADQTRLLEPGSDSGSEVLKALWGGLGPLPPRPDHRCDLLQGLGREHGPHLRVARLVPADARNGPDLWKEPGAVGVDGEITAVEPFDLTVAAGDDRVAFDVGLHSEPIRLRECLE